MRFGQTGPSALDEASQQELKGVVQDLPASAGIGVANWNWMVMHRFVWERFGLRLRRNSCLNWLKALFLRRSPLLVSCI